MKTIRNTITRRDLIRGLAAAPFAGKLLNAQTPPPTYVYPRWIVTAMQSHLQRPDGTYILVAAHRALWRDAPENSETALRNSFAKWEMVETDLRKSQDFAEVKDLMITHDPDISRTTNGSGYLYNFTMAQLAECRLLDRYGALYTGGNWYPGDANGTPLNDANTGAGQHIVKLSQLMTIQQDFLTGSDSAPMGPIIIMDVKGAVRGDPEFNQEGRGVYNTINTALEQITKLTLKQRRTLIFMVKFNILGSKSMFEQNVPAYQNYNDATGPLPKLMLVFNPEDSQVNGDVVPPASNANFMSWLGVPYLSHFEMNQYYLGDGCQTYIDYLNAQEYGISTYSENAFFPEGVWNINHFEFRNTDFSIYPVDFREVPDYALANKGVGLVTTERPDEMNAILQQYNLRNVPTGESAGRIKH